MANNQAKMNREQKEEFKNQMRDIALDFIEGDWEAERIDNLKDLLATLTDTFGAITPCELLASLYEAEMEAPVAGDICTITSDEYCLPKGTIVIVKEISGINDTCEVYLQHEPDTLFSIDERDLSPFGKIFQKQV